MNYCRINGVSFDVDVAIKDYEEYFNVLDGANAGRVDAGIMQRDIIGVFLGHKITFFSKGGTEGNAAFDSLWEFLLTHAVDASVWLDAADGQSKISYEAYYTSGSRKLKNVTGGVNYWDELSVNFIPMDAQIKP